MRFQKEASALMAQQNEISNMQEQALATNKIVPPKSFRPVLSCFSPKMLVKGNDRAKSLMPFNDFSINNSLMEDNDVTSKTIEPRHQSNFYNRPSKESSGKINFEKLKQPVEFVKRRSIIIGGETSKNINGKINESVLHNSTGLFASPEFQKRKWTSKSLFSKNYHPSPVATVIPRLRSTSMVCIMTC